MAIGRPLLPSGHVSFRVVSSASGWESRERVGGILSLSLAVTADRGWMVAGLESLLAMVDPAS